jgi:peptide/nickel transport system ATP-binding protein
MSSDEPLLSMDDVSIHFSNERLFGLRGSELVRAVDGVNLEISENDVVALVGESGCGKTTLGKTAIGLHRPTEGHVGYRGQDIWEAKDESNKPWRRNPDVDIEYSEIRRSLQMVHQDPESSLNANYTVESLLSDPLKRWEPGLELEDRRVRIYGLLEYVGMTPAEDYANRYPHQLSGGEQQRVALVRALLLNPDLILADEAVSALDVSLRVEMMDLMLELQNQFDTSYIFISHNLSNARYLAEKADGRIAVMYLGRIVEIGEPNQIVNDPQHPYTQVLRWATGDAHTRQELQDPPLRDIDVPDPSDPPSGCTFHTRCEQAREVCQSQTPELFDANEGQRASCFRVIDDHEYWDSEPLPDDIGDQSGALETDTEPGTETGLGRSD